MDRKALKIARPPMTKTQGFEGRSQRGGIVWVRFGWGQGFEGRWNFLALKKLEGFQPCGNFFFCGQRWGCGFGGSGIW